MKKKMMVLAMALVVALTLSSLTRIGVNAKEKPEDSNNKVLQQSAKKVAECLGLSPVGDKEVTQTVIAIPTEVEITPPAITIAIEPSLPLPAPPSEEPVVPSEVFYTPEQDDCQEEDEDENYLIVAAKKAGIIDKFTPFEEEKPVTFGRFALMCYNVTQQERKINTLYDRLKASKWLQENYPKLRKYSYSKKLSQSDVTFILENLQGQNPTSINLSGERTTCLESLQCLCEVFAPECLTSPR